MRSLRGQEERKNRTEQRWGYSTPDGKGRLPSSMGVTWPEAIVCTTSSSDIFTLCHPQPLLTSSVLQGGKFLSFQLCQERDRGLEDRTLES
jgi:hypothetical protein